MKKNVLVPYDGSTNAMDALQQAIALVKATGEKIVLLNVQPTFHTAHTKIFFSQKDIVEYQEQLCRETVAPAVKALKESGVPFDVRLKAGVPRDIILEEASRGGEDGVRLIVMGSHGHNPIVGSFLGTTSYGVLQKAPCPVMIVPYKDPEEDSFDAEMPT